MKIVVGLLTLLLLCPLAVAQNFTVTTGTFDIFGGVPPEDDILSPGPALVLGGTPGLGLDIDAFSYGRTGPIGSRFFFSVDFFSLGAPGSAVDFEVMSGGFGEQNVDVFRTDILTMPGTNIQVHDGNGIGPGGTAFPLGLAEPAIPALNPFGTGVDGYDTRPGPSVPGTSPIYFSWDPFGTAISTSPADLFVAPSVTFYSVSGLSYATSGMLGLMLADNIDAVEVYDGGVIGTYDAGDVVLFSLDPSSPSLGALGATPGDVLIASFGGATGVFLPGTALGLTPNDNLTALSVIIPEPTSALILAISAVGLIGRRRK